MARKSDAEMLGDFLREAACLVLVFGFLDRLVTGNPPDPVWMLGVVAVSALFLAGGAWLAGKE